MEDAAVVRDRQRWPFLMIPKGFFSKFEPTWKETAAYVALKYYACGDSTSCENVSVKALAKRAGVSESTMIRSLAELERKGAIKVRQRSRKTANGERVMLPCLYEILSVDTETTI